MRGLRCALGRRPARRAREDGGGARQRVSSRNPRALELMGAAEKPRGFATARLRPDYYHRLAIKSRETHEYMC